MRRAERFTLSPHALDLWLIFLDSQAHWRHSQVGHLEAMDVAGFAAALQMRQRAVDAEDGDALIAMWDAQRYTMNAQVNERIEAGRKS